MNVILGHYLLDKNGNLELNEYIRWNESDKVEKSDAWKTAIGLQYVGGLSPLKYLIEAAKDHIEGKISISEGGIAMDTYSVREIADMLNTNPETVRR